MNISILRKLGFTMSESLVYLALLDLGDSTRSRIIAESGITGSKVYEVLERLQQKGLVTIYLRNKIKHFKAQNPSQLLYYLEEKQDELDSQKELVNSLLPQLTAKFMSSKEDQEVELLVGLRSIRLFFMEQIQELKSGETSYVIGGTLGSDEDALVAFFRNVHLRREKKGIITKMLYNERQRKIVSESYSSKEFPLSETRFIAHNSAVSINIHKNKVLITVFGKNLVGIKITSQAVADSFMEYFWILWKSSKK